MQAMVESLDDHHLHVFDTTSCCQKSKEIPYQDFESFCLQLLYVDRLFVRVRVVNVCDIQNGQSTVDLSLYIKNITFASRCSFSQSIADSSLTLKGRRLHVCARFTLC